MRKISVFISLIVLAACAQTVDTENGLTRLKSEPKDCEYLYTMDSSATSYKLSGAYEYLEKTILDQRKLGDSYYVVNENIVENPDAVFGPKNTFKFKVKVYKCEK